MRLPKLNGRVDSEEVADMVVTHILVEIDHWVVPDTKKRLEQYVKEVIESVKEEGRK